MAVCERSALVLLTGDPVPAVEAGQGDFAAMIERAAGEEGRRWHWRQQDMRSDKWEHLSADAVIVSGSPASVTEALPWMLRAQAHLRKLTKTGTPVLGICFGHQLLAAALGGRVAVNPHGREMGTVSLSVAREDKVVGSISTFSVNATHVDSVVQLPPGAFAVGKTSQEPHAAVRFGPEAWGVQFHPEINGWAMRQYLEVRRSVLEAEKFPVEASLQIAADTPEGENIVSRFLQHVRIA